MRKSIQLKFRSIFVGIGAMISAVTAPSALAQEPILHLKFDGGVQNSGSGGEAKLYIKEGEREPQSVSGKHGKALFFDSAAAAAMPFNINHQEYPQVTVTAWVKQDAETSGDRAVISSGGWTGINLATNGGRLRVTAGRSGVLYPNAKLPFDEWVFVAAVVDVENGWARLHQGEEVFLKEDINNSNLGKPNSYSDPDDPAADKVPYLFVGATSFRNWGQSSRAVAIDDVRVYGEALSPQQIIEIRQASVSVGGTGTQTIGETEKNDPGVIPSGPTIVQLPDEITNPPLPSDILNGTEISEDACVRSPDGQILDGAFPDVCGTQIPGDQYEPAQLPGDQYDPTRLPGDQYDPTQLPGDQYDPTQLPGDQYEPARLPGDQYDPTQLPGDQYEPTRLPGDQYDPTQLPGDQYEPTRLPGDQYDPTQLPGDQSEPVQLPGDILEDRLGETGAPDITYGSEEEAQAAADRRAREAAQAELDRQQNQLEAERRAEIAADTETETIVDEPQSPTGQPTPIGEPMFTAVAGRSGETKRILDLKDTFLQEIRWIQRQSVPCSISINPDTTDKQSLSLGCASGNLYSSSPRSVLLQGSVIASVKVCNANNSRLKGIHVSGDKVNPDGSLTWVPASDEESFPNCSTWSSLKLCPSDTVGSGIVVHTSNASGDSEEIVGLQLVCRRVGLR